MVTVASLLQIMNKVGSLDSSRDLQSIYAKSFVNRLHLVLHACVETFDVMVFCVYGIYGVGTGFMCVLFARKAGKGKERWIFGSPISSTAKKEGTSLASSRAHS